MGTCQTTGFIRHYSRDDRASQMARLTRLADLNPANPFTTTTANAGFERAGEDWGLAGIYYTYYTNTGFEANGHRFLAFQPGFIPPEGYHVWQTHRVAIHRTTPQAITLDVSANMRQAIGGPHATSGQFRLTLFARPVQYDVAPADSCAQRAFGGLWNYNSASAQGQLLVRAENSWNASQSDESWKTFRTTPLWTTPLPPVSWAAVDLRVAARSTLRDASGNFALIAIDDLRIRRKL
jgi:hypothetical protein